jgi:hypothetical protein
LYFKVLFMITDQRPLETIQDIKKMMERSSRFISLSGWSGVAAGSCALVGAALAYPYIYGEKEIFINPDVGIAQAMAGNYTILLNIWLVWIAAGTFAAALASAFVFTWLKTKKQGLPIWGKASRRLMINVMIPMIAGGIFLFRMIYFEGTAGLIAPGCLIFYGLALINGSKYTLGEIRWLGMAQIVLGIINLWFVGYGLYFWAAGFGIMHIVYGLVMWAKYEKGTIN